MTTPPSSYTCRICNIPGHWIQHCPQKFNKSRNFTRYSNSPSTPPLLPFNYVCHNCGNRGHWISHCPNKTQLNGNNTVRYRYQNNITIYHSGMDQTPRTPYVCPSILLTINSGLKRYYKFMGKCENYYNNKFKLHCESEEMSVHKFKQNVYTKHYTGNHLGWDDNFPFMFRVNDMDRNILMHHLLLFLHENDGSFFKMNNQLLWPLTEKIGFRRSRVYHIGIDEYCVDKNDNDLHCKYCANPALSHRYLVHGYYKMHGNCELYVPDDVVQIICSHFDANSKKLYEISHRNDYILSYWKLHRHLDIMQHLKYDKIFGSICVNIYENGTVLFHRYDTIMPPRGYNTGKKGQTLSLEQIEMVKILISKYTKERIWYNYENAPRYECESGCELTQLLRCRIAGEMNNAMVYYDGYNEENKDNELWVFLNGLCNTIAGNICLRLVEYDHSPYKVLR
eukprot:463752_1